MYGSLRKLTLTACLALAALLTFAAAPASAHDGLGGGGKGFGRMSSSALVTEAAKQLSVTRAKLVSAIEAAAIARIDEAVDDEDVDADDAADLKEDVRDNLRYAMSIGRAGTVASELGVTTAKLNTEFRDARRVLILARINDAVAADDLDAEDAAELKEELADADLPGYKPTGFGFGFGGRHGGR